jgi:hypothetical protein
MECQKCHNKLSDDANFCGECGTKVIRNESSKAKTPVLDQVVKIGSIIIGYFLGRYLGLVIFIFIGAFLLGSWFPTWYTKREKISPNLVKWIVWSNVITWFLPPLGILTGFAALGFSNTFASETKKYKTLAIVGIVLSLINAASGILLNI